MGAGTGANQPAGRRAANANFLGPMTVPMMSESELRQLAHGVYHRIDAAFEEIDPDDAECAESLGSLTIELAGGAKWILSVQPPVRQLWLAVASLGRAFHFDYDPASASWRDDKGEGIELFSYLKEKLQEVAGIEVEF